VRELILAHKERSAWSLATPLGLLVAHAAQSLVRRGAWFAGPEQGLILVPVPSRRRTVRIRGHDPALRMTRAAASALRSRGVPAQVAPLLRVRMPVQDSVGLTASQRRRNLDDAFAASISPLSALRRSCAVVRVVVCDDVTTTGATLREACAALALAGMPASGAVTAAAVVGLKHTSQANT
jgi:predicted amidophosphoribosyltransferase